MGCRALCPVLWVGAFTFGVGAGGWPVLGLMHAGFPLRVSSCALHAAVGSAPRDPAGGGGRGAQVFLWVWLLMLEPMFFRFRGDLGQAAPWWQCDLP